MKLPRISEIFCGILFKKAKKREIFNHKYDYVVKTCCISILHVSCPLGVNWDLLRSAAAFSDRRKVPEKA